MDSSGVPFINILLLKYQFHLSEIVLADLLQANNTGKGRAKATEHTPIHDPNRIRIRVSNTSNEHESGEDTRDTA